MWFYGRGNSGCSWLPEEKKANMWYGRRNSGGSWPPAFPRSWDSWYEILKPSFVGINSCLLVIEIACRGKPMKRGEFLCERWGKRGWEIITQRDSSYPAWCNINQFYPRQFLRKESIICFLRFSSISWLTIIVISILNFLWNIV